MSAKKRFLENGGEMGSLIKAYNWAATSILDPEKWSQSHLSAINTMLTSRFPMLVFWGKDLITFYNDAFRPSLGNDGKHPGSLGQPGQQSWKESWPVIGPMINEIMSGGNAVWFEDQKLPLYRDGNITYAYWTYSFSPLLDDNGEVGGILVTCSETTKAVESLMELKEKEEQLQMALISADLGTWYINANTKEFLPSQRLKEIFGFNSEEDMPYDAAINQIADTHREEVINAVNDVLSKGIAYNLEYPIIGFRDNKLRWVKATGKVFNDPDGNPVHFSGTMSDITLRKEEDQRREDFLSIASHELKSPLTALKGYLQIMNAKAHTLANDMFINLTQRAVFQTEKMERLITGFLDLARTGKSKLQLNLSFFDLSDLAKSTEKETMISVKSHTVIYRPVEFTPVEADWDKIEQVLINLINNAVKYSPIYSNIKVACITIGDMAHFSVTDQGKGISLQHQEYIFERFYRIQDDANRNISGFGIGLYICKEIVNLHNGTIGVDSEIGKGSTFWFEIPISNTNICI